MLHGAHSRSQDGDVNGKRRIYIYIYQYIHLTGSFLICGLQSVAGKGYEIKIKFGDGAEADRHMAYATTNPTHLCVSYFNCTREHYFDMYYPGLCTARLGP